MQSTRRRLPPSRFDQTGETAGSLRIIPSTLTFPLGEPGSRQVQKVKIFNLSRTPQRILVKAPKTRAFTILNAPQGPQAPGIAVVVDVCFVTPAEGAGSADGEEGDGCAPLGQLNREFHDSLSVLMCSEKIDVSLHARAPVPEIHMESFVNLGVVLLKRKAEHLLMIRNSGSVDATFSVGALGFQQPDSSRSDMDSQHSRTLQLHPQTGIVSAGDLLKVKLEYFAKESGPFRQVVPIDLGMPSDSMWKKRLMLDVSAIVTEQHLDVLLPDGETPVENVTFGTVYYGQERSATVILANGGPNPVSFAISHPSDIATSRTTVNEGDLTAMDEEEKVVKADPVEGTLSAYGRLKVVFLFSPKYEEELKGFKSQLTKAGEEERLASKSYETSLRLEVLETGQVSEIAFSGRACRPLVHVPDRDFDFGSAPTNERRDAVLSIKNQSSELSVDYHIEGAAHFHAIPSRGRLMPLQSTRVILSFTPRQMGSFRSIMKLTVGGGKGSVLSRIPIRVKGEAVQGSARALVGGPNAMPSDFKPSFQFIEPRSIKTEQEAIPFHRKKVWEDNEEIQYNMRLGKFSYSVDELMKHQQHNKKYATFLQQSYNERSTKLKGKKPDYIDDLNIGMQPTSGLESPRLDLPSPKDVIDRASGAGQTGGTGRRRRSRRRKTDENTLIKLKFKSQPTTADESRECAMALKPSQLLCVAAATHTLDFGTVSVHSRNAKSFNLSNDLAQSVLVSLPIPDDVSELEESGPACQVLPPGGTAGFDIVLKGDTPCSFNKQIDYLVNNTHRYQLLVIAEIIPISLSLSHSELSFEFRSDHSTDTITETVLLTNSGNSPASFRWSCGSGGRPETIFSFKPIEGTVDSFGSREVEITFQPFTKSVNEEVALLHVTGGVTRQLLLRGVVEEAKLSWGDKRLDFGLLAVGVERTLTTSIRNSSKHDGFFQIEPAPSFTVIPHRARVPAGSSIEVTVSLRPSRPASFSSYLSAHVRGGRPVRVTVVGHAGVPQVTVTPEISFGHVYVGSTSKQMFTLKNTGTIAATLELNLAKEPEFTVDRKEIPGPIEDENGEPFVAVMDGDEGLEGDEVNEVGVGGTGLRYRLRVYPGDELSMYLVLTPLSVGKHQMQMPLRVAGMDTGQHGLVCSVVAEVVRPPLLVSQLYVDFGSVVLITEKRPYFHNVQLTNDSRRPLSWSLDVSGLTNQFQAEPRQGKLAPGQLSTVRLAFLAKEVGTFEATLPVVLSGLKDREEKFVSIEIHAKCSVPRITFDRSDVVLPVVPLGISSSAVFYVINEGYESTKLTARLPADTVACPLSIEWPQGDEIGAVRQRLPVIVRFTAQKPLSFTGTVTFFDSECNRFPLLVTGSSDNSTFTLFSFLSQTRDSLNLSSQPGESVMIGAAQPQSKKKARFAEDLPSTPPTNTALDMAITSASHSPAIDPDVPPVSPDFSKTCALMAKWLNVCVLQTAITSFPADVISSDGKVLIEAIEFLSGKQVSSSHQPLRSMSKLEKIKALMLQYEDMLNVLKGHGAMVNHVKAECLLSSGDYEKWLKMKEEEALRSDSQPLPLTAKPSSRGSSLTPHNRPASVQSPLSPDQRRAIRQQVELVHSSSSINSWLTIFLQMVKVYYLGRVVPRKGADKAEDMMPLRGSNVYSVGEVVLLRWLNEHSAKAGYLRRGHLISNFTSDLRDCLAFCAVLQAHVPSLSSLSGLKTLPNGTADYKINAAKLSSAMKEVGLDFVLSLAEFTDPSPECFVIFSTYLYLQLGQFVPKSTIEFSCPLNEPLTKKLELSNTSARPTSYHIKLEGDGVRDFAMDKTPLHIEPKSTQSLPITFTSRFTHMSEARLTLLGRREGATQASSLVFVLKGQAVKRSIKSFSVESPLFEKSDLSMEIVSPFEEQGSFQISLRQEQLPSIAPRHSTTRRRQKLRTEEIEPPAPTSIPLIHSKDQVFWVSSQPSQSGPQRIVLPPGEKVNVSMFFLPSHVASYRCEIVFIDDRVGEFVCTVDGKGLPPVQAELVKLTCEANQSVEREITIAPRNPLWEAAVSDFGSSAQIKSSQSRQQHQKKQKAILDSAISALPSLLKYKIEYSSPYITGPSELLVKTGGEGKPLDVMQLALPGESQANKLPLMFKPKVAGTYGCRVSMKSVDGFDWRVFDVEGTATAPGTKHALDFTAAARQSICQDIPIVNNSDTDWMITAMLTGEGFKGPMSVSCPSGRSMFYPLTYAPDWIGHTGGELTLTVQQTQDRHSFALRGTAEEPLSEDHVVINCEARRKTQHVFTVNNTTGADAVYDVESDLAHVSGNPDVSVPARSSREYVMTVQPPHEGTYIGSITFKDQHGRYSWYTIEAVAGPPPVEGTVSVKAVVRESVAISIAVTNPLDSTVAFEVYIEGENLQGPSSMVLSAKQSLGYEIVWTPLARGSFNGHVVFASDLAGEFHYELVMEASPSPPIVLQEISCEVGKRTTVEVELDNPSREEAFIRASLTNEHNYRVLPRVLRLPPGGSNVAKIEYIPSSLTELEPCEIVFASPSTGEWAYHLSGRGMPPTQMEPTVVGALIGEVSSSLITFRNPFDHPISINIDLEPDPSSTVPEDTVAASGAFRLLLARRKSVTMVAGGTLQISFAFKPAAMRDYKAMIVVELKELRWAFPIRGVAEAAVSAQVVKFKGVARESRKDTFTVKLDGYPVDEAKAFTYDLSFPGEVASEADALLRRVIAVVPVAPDTTAEGVFGSPGAVAGAAIAAGGNARVIDGAVVLSFGTIFSPLKAMKQRVELCVSKQGGGGRWRFPLLFEAAAATVDDVISIESAVGRTTKVAFRVNSQDEAEDSFKAFFSGDVPHEFGVAPSRGILPPSSKPGAQIVVSFSPTRYGRMVVGTLVVESGKGMQWMYEVRGAPPAYRPPVASGGRIDNKLSDAMQHRLQLASAPRVSKSLAQLVKKGK